MNPILWQQEPCADCGARPVVTLVAGPDGFVSDGARPLCQACNVGQASRDARNGQAQLFGARR